MRLLVVILLLQPVLSRSCLGVQVLMPVLLVLANVIDVRNKLCGLLCVHPLDIHTVSSYRLCLLFALLPSN